LVNHYNAKFNPNVAQYISTSSGDGIKGFLNGTLEIAASTDPLNDAQDLQANAFGKLTIPFTLTTFTIFTKKTAKLKLAASKIQSIYRQGGVSRWNQLLPGLSGNIIPVARSDSAGVNKIFSQWFQNLNIAWITPSTNKWVSANGFYFKSNIVFQSGNDATAAYIAATANTIGPLQTGVGLYHGLYESAIQNPAKKFVYASKADPFQSIPRVLPSATGNWNSVSLLNKIGSGTFPIASFIYFFARKKGGAQVKQFLQFSQSSAIQDLANSNYEKSFYRLPGSLTVQNDRAIAKIT
jgi:ABC-type phosphate transport system substrate-binding protein